MAPRVGFTLDALKDLQPTACSSDVRLGWKDGDPGIIGLLFHDGTWVNVPVCGIREIELLALQLLQHVKQMRERAPETEVIF
jgi:hypothetical protein